MLFTPKIRFRLLVVALSALLALPLTKCYAQFNSSVEGTVSDRTGAVIPGAQVTLHDLQTNIDRTDTTEATGYYRFNGIGPGDYKVTVDAAGFAKKVINTHVTQDQVASVNFSLSIGGASVTLTVTDEAEQLNPDETRLQTTLDSSQIENLPLQNGSPLEVVRIAPGVTGIDEDRSLWAASIGGNTMNAQANGRTNTGNTYQLDGVSIQNNTGSAGNTTQNHAITFMPAEDMVQEVSLEVNSYSVDWGGASSMKVNMTTKGGTNKFHGTLGDRYSGRGLNATADFAAPATPNSRRWYTGSIGGPIWKDKTFFFFSYMHQTQINSQSGLFTYADNDFTGTWAPANYPNSVNVKNMLVPFPTGSATGGQIASVVKSKVTSYGSDLFPTKDAQGNIIPDVCAVPIYSGLNGNGGTQTGSTPIPCTMPIDDQGSLNQNPRVNGFQINGRIDQNFRGGKDRIYGAYVLEPQVSDFIWIRPGFNTTTPGGSRYVNFNYSRLFSPNLVSQTALSYVRFYNSFNGNPANTMPFYNVIFGAGDNTFSNTDYFGSAGPTYSKNHNYQAHEDVTWTHGRHNVKTGLSVAHLDNYANNAGADSKPEVVVYFGGWPDVLDDAPGQYNLITLAGKTGKYQANIVGSQVTQVGVYAQDDWKVKPNLLVTFGLRWDNYGNPQSSGNGALPFLNMISPGAGSLQTNIASNSISTGVVTNAFSSAQNLNFLPRVGFAWTPLQNRKLTVHGGIGLYEDAMDVGGVVNGLALNSPSFLNLNFAFYASGAPLTDVSALNLYGTDWKSPAPFGRTYTNPAITPAGVDSHGEIIQFDGSILTSSLSAVDPHLKPQKTSLYSLQVEQELAHNLIAGVGYSGSFSWGQYATGDYNTVPGDLIANNGRECRIAVTGFQACQTEWGSINEKRNILSGNYNALLLTLRQNYRRLTWQAAFTWAKTLSHGGFIADINDPEHYYGPVTGSVPKSFNGSVAYELPGRGLHNFYERAALGGWEISGVATAQAGTPFSMTTSAGFATSLSGKDLTNPSVAGDYLANGVTGNLVNVPAGIKKKGYTRADFKAGIFSAYGYTSNSTPTWTNAAAQGAPFTNPTAYAVNPAYGNQGYNSFYGPGYLGLDSALHKKILLPWLGKDNGSTLTLGIEASNVLNRVNLQLPASTDLANVGGNSLGVSQAAYQARIFQVTGKFQF